MKSKTDKQGKKKSEKKRLVLLDSHAIIHRAYHALPDFSAAATGEPTGALYGLVAMLIKIVQELKPDYIVAAFDLSGPTYRHEAYDQYKAGRKENDENLELQLKRSHDIFNVFGIPVYSHPGFEADDIIGTIVYKFRKDKNMDIIIASGDMDTMQLVDDKKVQVYTLKKGLNDTILYDEERVKERFGFPPENLIDYKGLRGDPSDNIIGIKGIGEKTATSLIQTFGCIEDIYKALKKKGEEWKKAGITERVKNLLLENEEEALFSKTLATIRTDAPIEFILPKEWKNNFEVEKVLELFKELGFRTLSERVRQMARKLQSSDSGIKNALSDSAESVRSTPVDAVRDVFNSQNQQPLEFNPQEANELSLMLWVIDSNITNPNLEDVFIFTKTNNVADARKVLEAELDKRNVRKVFEEIEKPLMPIVEKMNKRGVKVDTQVLSELSRTYHKELNKLEKAIWKEAGEEFNINSPKVLSEILFTKMGLGEKRQKKTAGGALSTKESELEKLKDKSQIIGQILDYRELSKLLSTYIDAIPPLLDKGARLHSTFIQNGAVTGRMASNNPNLQNIPNKTELGRAIRNAFIPEKGFKLVSLDYSQIELRLAAVLSGDKKLMEIFKNGEDVHAGVAARVFKVPQDKVDKGMRIKAKTINFGILYGMGVTALQKNLGTDRKEAQEFYNEYFATFSGLAQYLDRIKAETARKGYTETLFGRRRYFAGFKSPLPFIRASAERMAINAPIQGTQADLIKIAMKKIADHIEKEGHEDDMRMILQVHDELVFEVKNSLVDEAAKHFKKIMETVISEDMLKGVPIVAEAHAGDNWGEMKSYGGK
jgi:DNA polymerase I